MVDLELAGHRPYSYLRIDSYFNKQPDHMTHTEHLDIISIL